MSKLWQINAHWEFLDAGAPEERACFAALGIYARGHCLTEGRDALANNLRTAPYLSAYALAEWLAWNWWRLRWEPKTNSSGWAFAHRMSNIGGGYIWPDIQLFSDGERAALAARPTPERPETPFRYISAATVMMPAADLETGIEDFIHQVLERLASAQLHNTNLAQIWQDVQTERRNPDLAERRKLEALLGQDPDEATPPLLDQLMDDARQIGATAAQELAASAGAKQTFGVLPSVAALRATARDAGVLGNKDHAVRLQPQAHPGLRAQTPAWRLGADVAQALRLQESLRANPVQDTQLAAMLGTSAQALQPSHEGKKLDFAYALEADSGQRSIVLRSHWHSGRRFEMARLLGDTLLADAGNSLFAATAAYTYQQKAQRAFAAELLSPFDAVFNMLDADYSEENMQEVANYFKVSELTIRTQLMNHNLLDPNELDTDQLALAA